VGVHLRRRDFLNAHGKSVPSLDKAINQIYKFLDKLNLKTVFLATDAPQKGTNRYLPIPYNIQYLIRVHIVQLSLRRKSFLLTP